MPTDGNSSPPAARASGPMFAESLIPGAVVAETYEITRLIGRGGMGAVWEAKHLRLPGRHVAIKVLLGGGGSDEILARFRREAEITSRLGHPNIVEVVDFNTLPDGTPYQVMERLAGHNLGERLHQGPMGVAETTALVRQIGSALAAAHKQGIVHRDLKPENIFLCPPQAEGQTVARVKVLDFGISKIKGAQTFRTQEAVVMGTPQYMSPEQAAGQNQLVDQRTDVFALGAIVYEMLSGRPAFAGDNVMAVMVQVMQGQPPPLAEVVPGLPAQVVAAVESALTKPLDQRCPDIETFVLKLSGRALDAATGPYAVPAGPVAPRVPSHHEDAFLATLAPAAAEGLSAVAHTQALPPTAPVAVPPRRGGVVLLAIVAAVGLTVGAFFFFQSMSRQPVGVSSTVEAEPLAVPAQPEPQPIAEPLAEPPKPIEPVVADVVAPKPAAARSSAPSSAPKLPVEVIAELDEAEALLAAGKPADALRKAKHSLFAASSSRAYAVMARAACAEQDLTNARAYLHNVGAKDRKGVRAFCAQQGLDLR